MRRPAARGHAADPTPLAHPVAVHPTRARALALVAAQPGIHFGALRRALEVPNGCAVHHLRRLVAAGLVVERRQPGSACYFLPGAANAAATALAPLLRSAKTRALLATLAADPGQSVSGAGRRLGIRTVRHHLRRLVAAGLVERRFGAQGFVACVTPRGHEALAALQAQPTGAEAVPWLRRSADALRPAAGASGALG